ncbi:hypothetical protein L6164_027049 [Bauhinia variegata]|uniref:Uncharacterized protein n=1 Tax=Bauhinia variegata TaxID=167791 RepID=A0ACB9LS68_BAUVA|nr:hypothetical protein L6164_027049 [Bauhinia variegata]
MKYSDKLLESNSPTDIDSRCLLKSKDGRLHLASVIDIIFNPFVCGTFVTGDDEGPVIIWDARSRKRFSEGNVACEKIFSITFLLNHEVSPCIQFTMKSLFIYAPQSGRFGYWISICC